MSGTTLVFWIVLIVIGARLLRFVIKTHYSSKGGQSALKQESVHELAAHAEALEGRIEVLESILDRDLPQWRNQR